MTHEEYLSRLGGFTDSAGDVKVVLSHAGSCALCRRESRFVERVLSRLDPARRSLPEEVARFGATAAVLALILLGIHGLSVERGEPDVPQAAKYRVVGNASGVVAYTPSGVVVGLAASSSRENGVTR